MKISRRDFLKYSIGTVATLAVGSRITSLLGTPALAAVQSLNITITDALKDMHTHNAINNAQCYFWVYKMNDIPVECPGPTIVTMKGDTVDISITNDLDEPHALFIPGVFNSGPIAPGATFSGTIDTTNASSGAYLYYDNLNEPVNRVMGLHGALIVMPDTSVPVAGHRFTPYDNPTPHVQALYDAFGSTASFPGLAWEEGDTTPWVHDATKPNVTPFRQYVWLTHQASPKLFAAVGDDEIISFTTINGETVTGRARDPNVFMKAFLLHQFKVNNSGVVPQADQSYKPQYFTINGQSGFFGHFNPNVTMMGRVGEPCVVHILNAGLWLHSMHLHANHFYVTSINGVVQENPIWVDVFNIHPMDRVDYTVPFMRPPSIPNIRGIGMPDTPLVSPQSGKHVWPPVEEFETFMPGFSTTPPGAFFNAPAEIAKDAAGNTIELGQRLSPLCYPMHDHAEPSQTSQGGNYNTGLISGIYFTGDRNGIMDFPMDEDFHMAFQNIRGVRVTQQAAPPIGEPQ